MSSPTPLERTIDQVLTKKESELLTQLNNSYLESLHNLELSKSQLELEYANIISNAEKKADSLKRQVVGSSKLSSRNKELFLLEQAVNDVFEKSKEKFFRQRCLTIQTWKLHQSSFLLLKWVVIIMIFLKSMIINLGLL